MAAIESAAEPLAEELPPSELESLPPSWPASPTGPGPCWRWLLPSATSGGFHCCVILLLVLVQIEFLSDDAVYGDNTQLHQRYLIDIDADQRQVAVQPSYFHSLRDLGNDVPSPDDDRFSKPLAYPKETLNGEQQRSLTEGDGGTVQLPAQIFAQAGYVPETLPFEYHLSFKKYILPILEAKCGACHGTQALASPSRIKVKGQQNFTSPATMLQGGVAGPALVPGDPQKSRLQQVLVDREMPPKGFPRLTAAEEQLIFAWVKTGKPDEATVAAVQEEKEAKYQGKVTAVTAGERVTVNGAQGDMTFHFDAGTTVVAANDPRFFPYEGKLDGLQVTVHYSQHDGKNVARLIVVGDSASPKKPEGR